MKNEWGSGKTTTPDGLIFVEELREGDEEENNGNCILLREDSDEEYTLSMYIKNETCLQSDVR